MVLDCVHGGTLHAIATPYAGDGSGPAALAARVILALRDARQAPSHPPQYLCDLFGLTQAEARLAALLQQGQSLIQAARALGISRHTARVHLNALFGKTCTHRQSELMRLMMGLPPVPEGL